ncbi:MAG TPA: transcriptional regulator/antitoxin, MazE [Thermoanaerobaculia bacterium]|nr:transcriptional regulator/antitoxin, MazE [Thermoanaerobaculia bacterium]
MVAKVQKWGNGQGVRLSKQVLELAALAVGDDVEITVSTGEFLVRKIARPKLDLAELVARIPQDYRSHEASFGPPVGREEG